MMKYSRILGARAVTVGYRLILASSADGRDGMALELTSEAGERLAEVFEDSDSRERTFAAFTEESVPVAAVQWLLSEASRRL
jgi:hypothetical protein